MKLLSIIIAFFLAIPAFAQFNMVNVDPLSGAANVVIPITTVSSGMASTSINLSYSGSGVKVKDVEANAGMGWQITGGGQITRELRGLPDDVKKDRLNNNRLGWLYNTNTGTIGSLTFANIGAPNCTNEATDITTLNSYLTSLEDTEPDVFSVSAPGLSCKFVLDNNRVIKTIPYQDVKISYTTSTAGLITSFKVINSAGVEYQFNSYNTINHQTSNTVFTGGGYSTVNENDIVLLKTPYLQFKNRIDYSSTWYLTGIVDPSKNSISFTYDTGIQTNASTPLEFYIGSNTKTTLYTTNMFTSPLILTGVSGRDNTVTLTYAKNYRTSVPMVSSIAVNGLKYFLNYSDVRSGVYSRYFLREITTDQCYSPFYYQFKYYGETIETGFVSLYRTELGDSTSKKIDFWGYQNSSANTDLAPNVLINPSNTSYQKYQIKTDYASRSTYPYSVAGANRMVDTAKVKAGALKQLITLNGGVTTIGYEPNDYYDPTASAAVYGGGIRVKYVNVYDGFNGNNNMIRSYAYNNPSTGITSGKPVTLPVYAFARPYTGGGTTAAQWEASTVRSELDLSTEDHSILYSHVTMTQRGAGKILYEYFLPATNYDVSAEPSCNGCTTDWAHNAVKIARPGCVNPGFLTSNFDTDTYPFAPNLNYDFERGLVKKVTNYNDDNAKVSETTYSYQRTSAPTIVTALKFDNNGTVKSYLKYNIYTATSELEQQVTNKVYDLNSTTLYQQTSTAYTYGSSAHKLATKIQTTKSDGAVENNYVKYTKDYNTTTRNDDYVNALYYLQQQNINAPVESYTEVVKGGVSKIVAASLTKFKPFTFSSYNLYLPAQGLSFFDQDGITASGFAASTVTSGLFVNDSRYVAQQNMTAYDQYGILQTSDNNRKSVRTMLTNYKQLPMAVVNNAALAEIGYWGVGIDVGVPYFVQTAGTLGFSTGRSIQGYSSSTISASATFSRAITKNTATKNYIFSAWINPAVTGNVNVVVKGTDNVPYTYSVAFTNTGGQWKYYEVKVPVAALSSNFTVTFQNMTSGVLSIDDVLFYPENAEVASFKYDPYNHKIIETNTNGISTYYSADAFGRPISVYNQDKHIVQQQSYIPADYVAVTELIVPVFSSNDKKADTWTPVTFSPATNYNTCTYPNLQYTWSFGDGTANVVTTTNTPQTHTFGTAGTYTVTQTVSATGFTPKSTTYTITILSPPPAIVPVTLSHNTTTGGAVQQVTFYRNGVARYTFTGAALLGGGQMVAVGSYTVTVKKDNNAGAIGSIYLNVSRTSMPVSNTSDCRDLPLPNGNYSGISIMVDSTQTIAISANDGGCI